MATDKQKEELADVLKFTPCEYKISVWGWGGEIVVGEVEQNVIDYFNENDISIEEYASGDIDEDVVPEDLQPFPPGSWFDCDNIAHGYGAFMDENNIITVQDENGNVVWEHNAREDKLAESGVTVEEDPGSNDLDDEQYAGKTVYIGTSEEKGTFYEGVIPMHAPFDPAKLTISAQYVSNWYICNSIQYDGVDISNDDLNTDGKSSSHEFIEL